MGFKPNKDFAVSPILNDQLLIDRLKKLNKLYISLAEALKKRTPSGWWVLQVFY